jgi:UDP-3-O-[3-hydroxymyristoyl] glucosamine N-acyltransferase
VAVLDDPAADARVVHRGQLRQGFVIGNGVIIHPGVRIGQDGFGLTMGPNGHLKVPQIGCVIIGDDVEIGVVAKEIVANPSVIGRKSAEEI